MPSAFLFDPLPPSASVASNTKNHQVTALVRSTRPTELFAQKVD